MQSSAYLVASICSGLMLTGCGHDWDGLDPQLGGSTSGGAAGASTAAGASGGSQSSAGAGGSDSGSGGSSKTGGTGGTGGAGCGQLLPSVPACGNLVELFDDPVAFDLNWYLADGASSIGLSNGEGVFHLVSAGDTVFAATHPDFTLKDCGIWVQIVQKSDAPGVMVRLSLSKPFVESRYSIGVLNNKLDVRSAEVEAFSAPYDPSRMRYVRAREAGGALHFGYSQDGRCWTEVFSTANELSGEVEGRIAVTHVPSGPGSEGEGRFDNYCVSPP